MGEIIEWTERKKMEEMKKVEAYISFFVYSRTIYVTLSLSLLPFFPSSFSFLSLFCHSNILVLYGLNEKDRERERERKQN